MKLHIISLSLEEEKKLTSILHNGAHHARVFQHAQILLKSYRGLKDSVIAEYLECGVRTVAAVRKRYCMEGLERALYDAPRSGRPVTYTPKDHATIVALACTNAPKGRATWTLDLLVEAGKKAGIGMKRNKIWTVLKEHELQPWRKKNVVHPQTQ